MSTSPCIPPTSTTCIHETMKQPIPTATATNTNAASSSLRDKKDEGLWLLDTPRPSNDGPTTTPFLLPILAPPPPRLPQVAKEDGPGPNVEEGHCCMFFLPISSPSLSPSSSLSSLSSKSWFNNENLFVPDLSDDDDNDQLHQTISRFRPKPSVVATATTPLSWKKRPNLETTRAFAPPLRTRPRRPLLRSEAFG